MAVLTRTARRDPRPELRLSAEVALVRGRAHEIAGPARHVFALALARGLAGPILWIRPHGADGEICGDGLARWVEPGRIVFATASRAADILWSVEEALASGAVPLILAEMAEPPPLTPVRRLHLAAERAPALPTALLLTPGDGGAQGIESRWHARPAPGWALDGRAAWHLRRTRARMAPEAAWRMEETDKGLRLTPERLAASA
ncbi:MAG: hypothetical protein AAF913_08065 [Pseudomonadota bacterium]